MTVRQVFYQATVRGLVEKAESGYTRSAKPVSSVSQISREPRRGGASALMARSVIFTAMGA
jgi:hypothetical protein